MDYQNENLMGIVKNATELAIKSFNALHQDQEGISMCEKDPSFCNCPTLAWDDYTLCFSYEDIQLSNYIEDEAGYSLSDFPALEGLGNIMNQPDKGSFAEQLNAILGSVLSAHSLLKNDILAEALELATLCLIAS